MKIAVTGANSSVGRNLLAHVAGRSDIEVIAGVRSRSAADSLPDSPRIHARIISYGRVGELTETLEGVSCAVHLAGILIEGGASTYEIANVAATRAVVESSQKAGVGHIVLISVLGAHPDSPNRFLRSKGEAEKAVLASGLAATIVRTPILLGPGTAGAEALVRTAIQRKSNLLGGGGYTMRPLDVDDLSRAVLGICEAQTKGVRVLELVGPEPIAYRDLVTRVAAMLGKEVTIGTIPVWIAKLGAAVTHRRTGKGISPTVIEVITANESVPKNADVELGLTLTPLSQTLEKILAMKNGTA
jgi:uncharacterized protein YbjT (DUF2867 family)